MPVSIYFVADTLNYKVEKAGFMSAVPYLAMATVLQFSGHIADYLRSRKILSTTNVIHHYLFCFYVVDNISDIYFFPVPLAGEKIVQLLGFSLPDGFYDFSCVPDKSSCHYCLPDHCRWIGRICLVWFRVGTSFLS